MSILQYKNVHAPRESWYFKNGSPAFIVIFIYFIILLIIAFLYRDLYSLAEFNLFTLLYTLLIALAVHSISNMKGFLQLKRTGRSLYIFTSYKEAFYHYSPYLIMAVIYENILLWSRAVNPNQAVIDHVLMKIDMMILGVNPILTLENFIHPFAVEYFMIAYGLFFIYPFVYLFYLIQKNNAEGCQRVILAQVLSLTIALTAYIYLPAVGPRIVMDPALHHKYPEYPVYQQSLGGVQSDALRKLTGRPSFFLLQKDLFNYLERINTDCLPSMHVCLCLISLFYAIKYRSMFKRPALILTLWITGITSLIFSTVYLRYHWVIDIIAGVLLALIAYWISELLYNQWSRHREKKGWSKPVLTWLDTLKLQENSHDEQQCR